MEDFLKNTFGDLPIPPIVVDIVIGIAKSIGQVFSYVWWIVIPLALAFYLWDLFIAANKKAGGKGAKWSMLELRIPKENLRSRSIQPMPEKSGGGILISRGRLRARCRLKWLEEVEGSISMFVFLLISATL
jgi:hypothetical protein